MLGAIVGDIVGSVYDGTTLKRKTFHYFVMIVFSQMIRVYDLVPLQKHL